MKPTQRKITLATGVAFLLAWISASAETFQVVQHINAPKRLPVRLALKNYGLEGNYQAYGTNGQALPSQQVGEILYVGLKVNGLETEAFEARKGASTPGVGPFKIQTSDSEVRVQNGFAEWRIGADGAAIISTAEGKTANLKPQLASSGKLKVLAGGPLVAEVEWTGGNDRLIYRFFAQAPYYEVVAQTAAPLATQIQIAPRAGEKTRLMSSLKNGSWGVWTYVDDIERDYNQFDFFFPFDWSAVEGDGLAMEVIPQSTSFRVNLQRVNDSAWRLISVPLADLKHPKFAQWHREDLQAVSTHHRFDGLRMPKTQTIGYALLKDTVKDGIGWHLQALPEVVVQATQRTFIGKISWLDKVETVSVEDRNKDGKADLKGDRWTWGQDSEQEMIYEFEGGAKMEKTRVYAGLPYRRGLQDSKAREIPRVTMTARKKNGTFCDGSLFFGGQMSDGYLAYDAQLSEDFTKDQTCNYEIESFDLDDDGISDIIALRQVNHAVATKEIPQFFGGEAGPMVNAAHRPILFGIALDPFTGYAQPLFPVRYQSAGDSLIHFWSLAKGPPSMPNVRWLQEVEGTLVGGHDWPQAVMDLSNDGYADVRFYTESYAVKRDASKPWSFRNVDLYANPMRWAINLDANHDHLTQPPNAHFQMSERARNWDLCIFPRRMVDTNTLKARLSEKGPLGVLLSGYTRFPFIAKRIYTDPWGNQTGFTGPNDPPEGWKGERVSYFDPKSGKRTGWGSGLDWMRTTEFDCVWVGYTDYETPNKHAPESTHPGINNMNRVDVDFYARSVKPQYRFYFSPVTGRLHLFGANFGYEYNGDTSYRESTLDIDKIPVWDYTLAYQYWVWAIDPDTYQPGQWWGANDGKVGPNRRFAYFDMDGDGYFDTYLWTEAGSKTTEYTSAFYLKPLAPVARDRSTPFLVQVSRDAFTACLRANLDFRSGSVCAQSMEEYQAMVNLTKETQNAVLASQNKERLVNRMTLAVREGRPVVGGFDPGFFVKGGRPVVALDQYHGGARGTWENLTENGNVAARTAYVAEGAETVQLETAWSAASLADVDVLVVNSASERSFEPGEIDALLAWIRGGGRVMVNLPAERDALAKFAPLLTALGVETGERFSTVEPVRVWPKILKNVMWFKMRSDVEFSSKEKEKSDIRDVSGQRLFFTAYAPNEGIDQLSLRSAMTLKGGVPLLAYKGQAFVTRVDLGKGNVWVLGSDDIFNNMCVAECMNAPRSMILSAEKAQVLVGSASSSFWNRFNGGIVVRNNLVKKALEGRKMQVKTEGRDVALILGRKAEVWIPTASKARVGKDAGVSRDGYRVLALEPGSYPVAFD